MATIREIKERLGPSPCRRCICKHYKVNLEPPDCLYYNVPHVCTKCHETCNIVYGLRLSGKMKLAGKEYHKK